MIWATDALEYLRIDDPIGAVPVHMVCGIWGTLSLGLFATGAVRRADADGRGHERDACQGPVLRRRHRQLVAQAIGSGAVVARDAGGVASC